MRHGPDALIIGKPIFGGAETPRQRAEHLGTSSPILTARNYQPDPRIIVGSTVIDRVSDTYSNVEVGSVLAIVGSTSKLEISINRSSAAKKLFVSRADPVRVEGTR